MFDVIFEAHPRAAKYDAYLTLGKSLRPDVSQIRGLVENIRYRSLTRPGWILSLSDWRDEKALVRWRTHERHHRAQERGRTEILEDYHLRVAQVIEDDKAQEDCEIVEQRMDETEVGEATFMTLVNASMTPTAPESSARDADEVFDWLECDETAVVGMASYDAFEAVLTPGEVLLLCAWRDRDAGEAFCRKVSSRRTRLRKVRVVRDYTMLDRREAPQFYPAIKAA